MPIPPIGKTTHTPTIAAGIPSNKSIALSITKIIPNCLYCLGLYSRITFLLLRFEEFILPFEFDFVLSLYDKPVPGTLTLFVLLPVELTVYLAPFPPNVTLVDFLPKFNLTPGAIFTLFLNRNPIESLLPRIDYEQTTIIL